MTDPGAPSARRGTPAGLARRVVRVPAAERAWFRAILEAYDGLAIWSAGSIPEELGGGEETDDLLTLWAPTSQGADLDDLLAALTRENPRLS